jgi:hypothetical protein
MFQIGTNNQLKFRTFNFQQRQYKYGVGREDFFKANP